MSELLKKVGFAVLVVAITAGIYFFMFVDKRTQQEALRYTLAMIGDRMFKLMPAGKEKVQLQTQYDDFIQQAVARKIPPGDVEKVAAQVLSITYQDTILEPEIKFLYSKLGFDSLKGRGTWLDTKQPAPAAPPVKITVQPPVAHDNKTWDSLNIRLNSVAEFDIKIKQMMARDNGRRHSRHRQIHIMADSGIKIIIDDSLRLKFSDRNFKNMNADLRKLEKQRIIVWKKNYMRQMEGQLLAMQEQLKQLHQLQKLEQLKALQHLPFMGLRELRHLEALKSLDSLKYLEIVEKMEFALPESIQVVWPDSIHRIIEQNLESAGIIKVEVKRTPPPPPPPEN